MDTRRRWLGSLLATCTLTVWGCEAGEGPPPAPTRAAPPTKAAAGPQAWEPVDPAFTGCGGS